VLAKFGQFVGVVIDRWGCRGVFCGIVAMRITRNDQDRNRMEGGFICGARPSPSEEAAQISCCTTGHGYGPSAVFRLIDVDVLWPSHSSVRKTTRKGRNRETCKGSTFCHTCRPPASS
jgi:hypothetical protein